MALTDQLGWQIKGSATNGNSSTVTLDISKKTNIVIVLKIGTSISQSKIIPTSILTSGDTIPLGIKAVSKTSSTVLVSSYSNSLIMAGSTATSSQNRPLFMNGGDGVVRYSDQTTVSNISGPLVYPKNLYSDLNSNNDATVTYNGNNSFTLTNGLSDSSTLYLLG